MDYASRYAELAVRVGVNLQAGQKLVVYGEPEHAPLLRAVAEAGWRAGAGDVVCFYVDDHVRRLHALHAADELLDRTPACWRPPSSIPRALPSSSCSGTPIRSCSRMSIRAARAEPRRRSAVGRRDLLFRNLLLDENASSHVAIGTGYTEPVEGSESMDDAERLDAGINVATVHIDLMVGGPEVDVDGIGSDGSAVPVLRQATGSSASPPPPRRSPLSAYAR